MTNEEVAALEPGVYLLRYDNGASDLAAVGEIIGDEPPGRWYMSASTIVSRGAARRSAVGPWIDWSGVRSATMLLVRRDIDEVEREPDTAHPGERHEPDCRCEWCKVHA